jgi:hypothetical protein
VSVCVSPLSLLRNGSVKITLSLLGNGSLKIPLSLLGNGSVKVPLSLLGNVSVVTLPRQRIHTQQYKNRWTRRFQCGPCRIKESRRLVLSRTSCLIRPLKWVQMLRQQDWFRHSKNNSRGYTDTHTHTRVRADSNVIS